ncbi:MAG: divalent metal cation transporter [Gammaproteobacteria bacterium]|nr:divalent metal cation transporter [Gammaproteobacteria bacterium]
MTPHKRKHFFLKKFFRKMGPGVITGTADDDPSGIATYSQTGAQFGYAQLWTALFMLPMQIAIQESCARIGAVTGTGIAAVIKEYYSKKVLYLIVSLLLIANTINIGVDIGAMAAAIDIVVPVNMILTTLIFTITILALEIFIPYKMYSNILKWLCLSLFAYPLTLFIIQADWLTILKATFIPHFEFNFEFIMILTGLLGTTISPYLFFWQASQEVEEEKTRHLLKEGKKPRFRKLFIRSLRFDNFIGMVFSQAGSWAIVVTTATVLHTHGITDIKTAADAAKALEPLVQTFPHAGLLAKIIFATGIIGLGLLSIPVLAASSAYALGDTLKWKVGLNLTLNNAHGFYGTIILGTLLGLTINFMHFNPIKALIYTAVLNGIVAVPLILIIILIGRNEKIMGEYKNGLLSNIFVWLTFICMAISAVLLIFIK